MIELCEWWANEWFSDLNYLQINGWLGKCISTFLCRNWWIWKFMKIAYFMCICMHTKLFDRYFFWATLRWFFGSVTACTLYKTQNVEHSFNIKHTLTC